MAKKDFTQPEHPEIKTVPTLQVINALRSLKSRGYVQEQFSWGWYYWYLTNEGKRNSTLFFFNLRIRYTISTGVSSFAARNCSCYIEETSEN